jgi:GntR family transcriptional regulator
MSMVKVNPDSPIPLYAQVESILATGIADGTFGPESQLPNEDELIERYAVSRTTIRQTIQNLMRRGLVEIRRGKGTQRIRRRHAIAWTASVSTTDR